MSFSHRAVLFCAVVAVGCQAHDQDGPGPRSATSRDLPIAARLSPEPILSIGDGSGGPATFDGVAGVHVIGDSLVVVVDAGAGELRYFRFDGSHVATSGGTGRDPGEFVRPRLLGIGAVDSLIVLDRGSQRIHVLDAWGSEGRSFPLISDRQPLPVQAFSALADGTVILQILTVFPGPLDEGDVLSAPIRLALLTEGSAAEEIGTAATPAWIWTDERQVRVPFSPTLTITTDGDRVVTLSPDGNQVEVYARDEPGSIWESPRTPTAVTDQVWADERRRLEDRGMRQETIETMFALRENRATPATSPVYDRVVASSTGDTWACLSRGTEESRTWDVYASDGRFVGTVSTPRAFTPSYISEDLIVGVRRGLLGVESVVGFGLEGLHEQENDS